MSVKIAFFWLSFKTLRPTISWTITAVSTQSSLHYFWCHSHSKRWLPRTTIAARIQKSPVWQFFFILHTKHHMVKTETEPKTMYFSEPNW